MQKYFRQIRLQNAFLKHHRCHLLLFRLSKQVRNIYAMRFFIRTDFTKKMTAYGHRFGNLRIAKRVWLFSFISALVVDYGLNQRSFKVRVFDKLEVPCTLQLPSALGRESDQQFYSFGWYHNGYKIKQRVS